MGGDQAIELMTRLLRAAMTVAAPVLIVTLLVGLSVSVLQVATQLQEMTLSYVPKLVAAALVMIFAGPWMLGEISRFSAELFLLIPALG
jgi:flagellar biosynthetic protein FliQ